MNERGLCTVSVGEGWGSFLLFAYTCDGCQGLLMGGGGGGGGGCENTVTVD